MRQARVALGILALTGLAAALAAGDWPGFRGLREGVSDERGLPERWSATEGIAWRAAVPGAGWSSPIVSGDRVFVTTATEEGVSCRMLAFDRRTGALLWTTEAFKQKPTLKERQNSYATPTPVTDGERVYAVFGEGGAAAFSFDGRVLWTNTEHPFYSQHGLGASPILVDGSRPPAARRQLGRRGQDARVAEAVGPVVPPRPRRADGADGVPGEARPLPHRPRDAGGGDGGRPPAGGEPGRRRRAGLRARHRPPALDGAERGRGRRAVRRAGRRPRGHRLRLRRPRPPRLPPRRQRRRDRHPPRLGAEEGGADDQLTRRGRRPRLRGE